MHFSTGHLAQHDCNPGDSGSFVKASEQPESANACWRLPVPFEFSSMAIIIHKFLHEPLCMSWFLSEPIKNSQSCLKKKLKNILLTAYVTMVAAAAAKKKQHCTLL